MAWRLYQESKYHSQKTTIDNITFDSKKEANRYQELKLLQIQNLIKDLVLQPEYPLVVNNKKVCTYRADFCYYDNELNKIVVEDVKGLKTPVYRLKKKLLLALYTDINFKEI